MIKVCEICGDLERQSEESAIGMEDKKHLHLCENCRQERSQPYE